MSKRFTVVTMATDFDHELRTTLAALYDSIAGVPFESTIVQNGVAATDSWPESLPYRSKLLSAEDMVAPGAILNKALAEAEGEFVAFLPAGTVPERHWATAVVAAFERKEVAAVAPRVLDQSGERVRACGAGMNGGRIAHAHAGCPRDAVYVLRPTNLDLAPLCGLVVRHAYAATIGGYDAGYATSLFDYDWALQARVKGFGIAYRPDFAIRYGGPLLLGHSMAERECAERFFKRWKTTFAPYLDPNVFLP